MFPDAVVVILQQLSYIVIILCGVPIMYFCVRSIVNEVNFKNHEKIDAAFHQQTSEHIGKFYSYINDLRMDVAAIVARNSDK